MDRMVQGVNVWFVARLSRSCAPVADLQYIVVARACPSFSAVYGYSASFSLARDLSRPRINWQDDHW